MSFVIVTLSTVFMFSMFSVDTRPQLMKLHLVKVNAIELCELISGKSDPQKFPPQKTWVAR